VENRENRYRTHVAEAEIPWEERRSPRGRFAFRVKEISRALTAPARALPSGGASKLPRPFEVDLFAVPPGAHRCPRHAHSQQWEYYIVLAGEGRFLWGEGEASLPLRRGDHVLAPPGFAHTLENTGEEDLVYYVVSSNPEGEAVYYPDSDKWMLHPGRIVFRMAPTDYYDGEE